ncbi:MAG: aspartyl-tRNA synthetase [Candidatus Doudnabacteria bacterium]|nr:aspartyl-tRNA synthetase [Candidatus Doudnabacteria bacterium]
MKRTLATETVGHVGKEITVKGWINSRRDHGNLIFIDLRDHSGIVQITVNPDFTEKESFALSEKMRDEWVIEVTGTVQKRAPELINTNFESGTIEIQAKKIEVLASAKTPPFPIAGNEDVNEEVRLKYRYLDLRRPKLQGYLKKRAEFIKHMRDFMHGEGFWEITTPILANSSPEGARDFLVPSRLHPGKFYALPQAPQQFKQLLMVGGIPRYYQIAPCFRDEDPRADRSPGEFYQLDMEMAFATQEEVWEIMEELMSQLTEKFSDKKVFQRPFPKIRYEDAMNTYGSDKPDLRFELILQDVSELVKDSGFSVFSSAVKDGGVVKAIVAPGAANFTRSQIDDLTEIAKAEGAKGLAYIVLAEDGIKSPIVKFLGDDLTKEIIQKVGAKTGDIIFFGADMREAANKALGKVRNTLGGVLGLKDQNLMAWAWIYDFPMYSWSDIEDKLDFEHNPFSMPVGGIEALNDKDPLTITAYQYDLVANGYECSSGAVRNHQPETMFKAFELAGYTREQVMEKFGHMIEAFSYGAPPHAGNAPGIDRIFMVLNDESNIREIIAFPKNGKAEDLMLDAPSVVSEKQLRDVHIKLDIIKK